MNPIYEEIKIEAANRLRGSVLSRDKDRFRAWNQVADAVRPMAKALVSDKVSLLSADAALRKTTIDAINWDIIHLCFESEYSDIVEPGFFHAQAFYYRAGHFRCGCRRKGEQFRWIVY